MAITPLDREREQRRQEINLIDITALKARPETERYLKRRINEMVAKRLDESLEDGIGAEEREIRHRIWRSSQEFASFIETDEITARRFV